MNPIGNFGVVAVLVGAMDRAGLRQRDLALKAKLSPAQMSDILSGRRYVSPRVAVALGAALGLEPLPLLDLQFKERMARELSDGPK